MATTYVPSNLNQRGKDFVRWRVGDVDGKPQWFLQDEEIEGLLATYVFGDGTVNIDEICALCAESIGAQCIQLANTVQQRNLKLDYGNRANAAFELATRIRNLAQPAPGSPVDPGAIGGKMHGTDCMRRYDELTSTTRPLPPLLGSNCPTDDCCH